jgi:hypothetical protein
MRSNKAKSLVDLSPNTDLRLEKLTQYTSIFYKDYSIGSMFHGGKRANKFSINVTEGTEFETYLKGKIGETVLSDSEGYKVGWLDLNIDNDFDLLADILVELPAFEGKGLRKLRER